VSPSNPDFKAALSERRFFVGHPHRHAAAFACDPIALASPRHDISNST
jgi:hypothetical protein